MTRNHKFILSICLLLLSSCGAGVNSSFEELSGGYYFRESGSNLNYIASHTDLRSAIYSKIIAFENNSDFIIAAQRPNLKYHRTLIASHRYAGPGDVEVSEKSADSILTHDPYYLKIFSAKLNYWIIVSRTHELIGPLTKGEYMAKRKELNIPEGLELDVRP